MAHARGLQDPASEPSRSGRRSWGYSGWLAGQRSVPSGCRVKAEPGKPRVKEGRAHWGGPYVTGDGCFGTGGGSMAWAGSTTLAWANSVVRKSDEESVMPSSRSLVPYPTSRGSGKTPGRTGYESTSDPNLARHLHQRELSQTILGASRGRAHPRQ
jgi:hypothetical protein